MKIRLLSYDLATETCICFSIFNHTYRKSLVRCLFSSDPTICLQFRNSSPTRRFTIPKPRICSLKSFNDCTNELYLPCGCQVVKRFFFWDNNTALSFTFRSLVLRFYNCAYHQSVYLQSAASSASSTVYLLINSRSSSLGIAVLSNSH